jgi:hypothetical protein
MGNPNRRHPRYLYRDQLEGLVSVSPAAKAEDDDTEPLPCAVLEPASPVEAGAGVGPPSERAGLGDR